MRCIEINRNSRVGADGGPGSGGRAEEKTGVHVYVCVHRGKGWKIAQMAIPSGALVKDLLGDTAVHEFCNQTMK